MDAMAATEFISAKLRKSEKGCFLAGFDEIDASPRNVIRMFDSACNRQMVSRLIPRAPTD